MMSLKFTNIISLAVLLFLFVITFAIIYHGPLQALFKDDNIFVQSTISLGDIKEPLEWPALTICKHPFYKDREKHNKFLKKARNQSFENKSEYKTLLEESFFTKPSDFVYRIGYSDRFEDISNSPPDPTYVRSRFVDVIYFGYCVSISFEAIRSKMIVEGKVNEKDTDSKLFMNVGLKANTIISIFTYHIPFKVNNNAFYFTGTRE